jgi:hypothetical protein
MFSLLFSTDNLHPMGTNRANLLGDSNNWLRAKLYDQRDGLLKEEVGGGDKSQLTIC